MSLHNLFLHCFGSALNTNLHFHCCVIIGMSSGRTCSAGSYITLPDMGVSACGRKTATQLFSRVASR